MSKRPTTPFEIELEAAHVDEFCTRGFVRIARITSDEELAWLREVYDALFAEKRGAYHGGYFDLTRRYDSEGEDLLPQIIAPESRLPGLKETNFWKNGAKLARHLLQVDGVHGWGHMIRKPARIGESLPWHQDEAYWDPAFDYRALGCWMPLDTATVENGCMSMIPGSHLGDIVAHRHLDDDPSVEGLETVSMPTCAAEAVPLPTAAGGAVLHHSRMLHRSGPNTTDAVRRAYANEWQTRPVQRAVPYERPWYAPGREAHASRFGKDVVFFE
jgi:ectoine hydroxylase-related dioxygenase (phytanoyl-CoA dioxygenase family)